MAFALAWFSQYVLPKGLHDPCSRSEFDQALLDSHEPLTVEVADPSISSASSVDSFALSAADLPAISDAAQARKSAERSLHTDIRRLGRLPRAAAFCIKAPRLAAHSRQTSSSSWYLAVLGSHLLAYRDAQPLLHRASSSSCALVMQLLLRPFLATPPAPCLATPAPFFGNSSCALIWQLHCPYKATPLPLLSNTSALIRQLLCPYEATPLPFRFCSSLLPQASPPPRPRCASPRSSPRLGFSRGAC